MKVKIENYQSIKNIEFEVKGLTVISGANNTGKSACARAISGVFSNTRGNSHVRVGESHSTVRIDFEDSNVVEWKKGKGVNSYEVNGDVIDKVGTSVPDEVKNLGVFSVDVSGKEVWPQISKQFEQVFLLDLPPNVLSSALSNVDKIQALERASGLARSEVKSTKSRLKVKREDLEEETSFNSSFTELDDLEQTVSEISDLETQISDISDKLSSYSKILDLRKEWTKVISESSDSESVSMPPFDSHLSAKVDDLERLKKEKDRLQITVMAISIGVDSYPPIPEYVEIDSSNFERVHSKRVELKRDISDMEELLKIRIPSLKEDSNYEDALSCSRLISEIYSIDQDLAQIEQGLSEVKEEIGEICPLCDSPIDHTH